MKRFLLFLLFASPLAAQISNPGVTYVGSAPSGACSQAPPVQVLNSSGAIYTCDNGTWAVQGGGGGSGTVTSVALTGSANLFSSTPGTAVTTAGNLNLDSQLLAQAANCILAGPASGSAAAPTCRALVSGDIPNNAANTTGTAGNVTATSNSTLTTLSALSLPYSQVTGGPSGTVTSFSAGNLSPLFTSSVATSTTTPALTFALSNAAQNSVLAGPATGGAGAPSYQTAPTISAANMTNFPASAAYTPLTYLAYGDSITIATNGAVTYPNNSYVARIAAQLGIPGGSVTNQAVSGAMAGDVMSLQVLPNDAPAETAQQPLRTLLISTNEASIKGAGAYEATFNTIDQAILAWESIAAPYKVMGSTVVGSTTGTCAQDNTYANALGVLCTSNAATAPFSITTTGGPIYIWYRCIDSDAGTWTYAIDGGSTVAVTTALTTAIATTNGTTASVCLIRVPASAAAHTLSFVKTSTGGNMGIIGVGTVSNSLVNSQPYIIAGDTPSELNGAAASAVAAYRADIVANVALLAGDGLNIQLKYISKYLIATTAASDMFNTLHPNDQGHGEMAAAFLGGSGLFPATSGASPYYNAQNASYVPGAGNQVVSIAATSGTVTLNVQASGTVYWIVNRSSSTNLTLAAGSGVTINGAATIPPLGVAVAISTGSSWAIGPASNAITTLYQGPSAGYTIAPGNQVTAMNCIANCTLAIGTGTYGQVEYVANRSATYTVTVSGTISSGPTSIPPLGGAIYVSSNSAWWGVAVGAQNGIYTPNGTPTYTAGTNVTSVGCASGYTCTNTRGELTIVGGTATTGTIATLNFSATLTAAPGLCIVTQAGGASLFGIGHGTPATTGFTITAGVSVATSTVTVDYSCQP